MSRMQTKTAGRRARRRFTSEFKAGAVRLVLDAGKTIGAVARELDLTPSALGGWVARGKRAEEKWKWAWPTCGGRSSSWAGWMRRWCRGYWVMRGCRN